MIAQSDPDTRSYLLKTLRQAGVLEDQEPGYDRRHPKRRRTIELDCDSDSSSTPSALSLLLRLASPEFTWEEKADDWTALSINARSIALDLGIFASPSSPNILTTEQIQLATHRARNLLNASAETEFPSHSFLLGGLKRHDALFRSLFQAQTPVNYVKRQNITFVEESTIASLYMSIIKLRLVDLQIPDSKILVHDRPLCLNANLVLVPDPQLQSIMGTKELWADLESGVATIWTIWALQTESGLEYGVLSVHVQDKAIYIYANDSFASTRSAFVQNGAVLQTSPFENALGPESAAFSLHYRTCVSQLPLSLPLECTSMAELHQGPIVSLPMVLSIYEMAIICRPDPEEPISSSSLSRLLATVALETSASKTAAGQVALILQSLEVTSQLWTLVITGKVLCLNKPMTFSRVL